MCNKHFKPEQSGVLLTSELVPVNRYKIHRKIIKNSENLSKSFNQKYLTHKRELNGLRMAIWQLTKIYQCIAQKININTKIVYI